MKLNNILGVALGNFWRWEKNPNRASLIKYAKQFNLEGIELTVGRKGEAFAFSFDEKDLEFLSSQRYVSIHAPFHILRSTSGEDEIIKLLTLVEEIYNKTNAKTVVFHPNDIPPDKVLKRFNFHMSIENMPKNRWFSIADLEKLLERYKNAGLCLDTAHAFSYSQNHLKEIIDRLGDKITQVHLSGRGNGRDHVRLRDADEGFYESLKPLKKLNVPIIIEEDLEFDMEKAKEEVEEIKKFLYNL